MSTQNPDHGSTTDPSVQEAAHPAPEGTSPASTTDAAVGTPAPERDILTEDTVQQETVAPAVDPAPAVSAETPAASAPEQPTRSYAPHTPQRAYSAVDEDTTGVVQQQADTGAHPYPAAAYAPVGLETATATATAPEQPSAFPLYVQAPSAPDIRGNRGFGILIGLLGTIVFAALYASAVAGLQLLFEDDGTFVGNLVQISTSWPFLLAAAGFFLSWVITATLVNRSGWVHWVLGGFIIGLVTFLAWVAGFLIQERAWTLSIDEILAEVTGVAFTFGPVLAFIVAREIPVWLGGWIASRGRKVRDANLEAQAEYERVLEAGPTTAR